MELLILGDADPAELFDRNLYNSKSETKKMAEIWGDRYQRELVPSDPLPNVDASFVDMTT